MAHRWQRRNSYEVHGHPWDGSEMPGKADHGGPCRHAGDQILSYQEASHIMEDDCQRSLNGAPGERGQLSLKLKEQGSG